MQEELKGHGHGLASLKIMNNPAPKITRDEIARRIKRRRFKTPYTKFLAQHPGQTKKGVWKYDCSITGWRSLTVSTAMASFKEEAALAWNLVIRKKVAHPDPSYGKRDYTLIDHINIADPKDVTVWVGLRNSKGEMEEDSEAWEAATGWGQLEPEALSRALRGSDRFYLLRTPAVAWAMHTGDDLEDHLGKWELRVFNERHFCIAKREIAKS